MLMLRLASLLSIPFPAYDVWNRGPSLEQNVNNEQTSVLRHIEVLNRRDSMKTHGMLL